MLNALYHKYKHKQKYTPPTHCH